MATLTVDDMLKWPMPNHEDPETLAPAIYGVNIPFLVLMTAFVAGRFWSRVILLKGALAADDWTMLAAYILCAAVSICHMVEVKFGVGLHLYDVRFDKIDIVGKMTVITQCMFAPAAAVTKISICLTYLRLFPSRTNKWFNYTTIVFLVVFGISTSIVMALECRPISDFWNVTKPMKEKSCIKIEAFYIYVAAANATTDLLVYLWPVQYLWGIQLSLGKRIGLCISFGLGVVICIVGLVRIWQVVEFFKSWDQTWNGAIMYLIITVEISLGVICGCIPGIRPLMSKLLPGIFGITFAPSSKGNLYPVAKSNSNHLSKSGDVRRFRELNSIEVTKDIELTMQTELVESDSTTRPETGYTTRQGSDDWMMNPYRS